MAEKKYKVSKGVCLTAKGVMYKEGDEIPGDLLTDESVKALLAKKKIEASQGSTASDSKTDKVAENAKKAAEAEAKKKAEEEAKKAAQNGNNGGNK